MCRPGQDRSNRSSPPWCVLALGIEQIERLEPSGHPLASCASLDAWQKLYRLDTRSVHGVPASTTLLSPHLGTGLDHETLSSTGGISKARRCRLESLPLELLSVVTSYLFADYDSPMALALCSTYLWEHVVNQELPRRRIRGGVWAGQPLICTAASLTELPPSVLAYYPKLAEDVARWEALRGPVVEVTSPLKRPFIFGQRGLGPANDWNWDALSDWDDAVDFSLRSVLMAAFEQHSAAEVAGKNMTEHTVSRLRQMLEREIDPLARSETKSWVLRNVDTEEYVPLSLFGLESDTSGNQRNLPRTPDSDDHEDDGMSFVAADDEKSRPRKRQKKADTCSQERFLAVPGTPWLTPDFIIMSQICWCNGSPDVQFTDSELLQGPWAGHRFDIVEKAHASALFQGTSTAHGGKAWTDVTMRIFERCTSLRTQLIEWGIYEGK